MGTICMTDLLQYWTLGNVNFRIRQTDQSSNAGSSNFYWFELSRYFICPTITISPEKTKKIKFYLISRVDFLDTQPA